MVNGIIVLKMQKKKRDGAMIQAPAKRLDLSLCAQEMFNLSTSERDKFACLNIAS